MEKPEQDTYEPEEALREIRSIMERSTRFLSLSGLSGVFLGLYALIGAGALYWYVYIFRQLITNLPYYYLLSINDPAQNLTEQVFVGVSLGMLILGLGTAILLSVRKGRRNGHKIWDATAKRMVYNLLIPLITGGIFILILAGHSLYEFIFPVSLIFYGLALVNASKYTLPDIRWLGLMDIALGLAAANWPRHGLILWAVGFGVLHIVYGLMMYRKYR